MRLYFSLFIAVVVPGAVGACGKMKLDCGDRREITELSEHFEYHYCEGDEEVGSDLLPELERHLNVMVSYLGMSVTEIDTPIVYLKDPRGSFRGGFRSGSVTLQVSEAFLEHELVHAYVVPQWGGAPSLLAEGLASSLGCDAEGGLFADTQDWRGFLHFDPLAEGATEGYKLGQYFVTRLLTSYGVDKLRDLYQRSGSKISNRSFERLFEEIYTLSLDDVWAEALAAQEFCVPVWDCASPALKEGSISLSQQRPRSGARLLELNEENGVMAQMQGSGFTTIRCESLTPVSRPLLLAGGEQGFLSKLDPDNWSDAWLDLPPGSYALIHMDLNVSIDPGVSKISLPLNPWQSPNCQENDVILLPHDRVSYVVINDSITRFSEMQPQPRLRFGTTKPGTKYQISWDGFSELVFCADCTTDIDCTNAKSGDFVTSLDSPLSPLTQIGDGFTSFVLRPEGL